MDRIAEIVRLQKETQETEDMSSIRRWRESELIWEEHQSKTFRALSDELRAAGGACSLRHLQLMNKCWEISGKPLTDAGTQPSALPPFNGIYHSDEVRGEQDGEGDGQTGSGKRKRPQPDEQMDYTTHGLVMQAANAVDALARNKAHHPLLTDSDRDILRAIPPTIRALLRESSP